MITHFERLELRPAVRRTGKWSEAERPVAEPQAEGRRYFGMPDAARNERAFCGTEPARL